MRQRIWWMWEGWLWERWLWEGRRCKSQRVSSRTSLKPAWPSYILKTGWRPAAAVASYLMSFVMCFAHAGLSRVANSPLPQASSMDLNVSILLAGVPVLPAGVATLLGAGAAFAANGFEVGASADPVASAGLEPPQPILSRVGVCSVDCFWTRREVPFKPPEPLRATSCMESWGANINPLGFSSTCASASRRFRYSRVLN